MGHFKLVLSSAVWSVAHVRNHWCSTRPSPEKVMDSGKIPYLKTCILWRGNQNKNWNSPVEQQQHPHKTNCNISWIWNMMEHDGQNPTYLFFLYISSYMGHSLNVAKRTTVPTIIGTSLAPVICLAEGILHLQLNLCGIDILTEASAWGFILANGSLFWKRRRWWIIHPGQYEIQTPCYMSATNSVSIHCAIMVHPCVYSIYCQPLHSFTVNSLYVVFTHHRPDPS